MLECFSSRKIFSNIFGSRQMENKNQIQHVVIEKRYQTNIKNAIKYRGQMETLIII